jgi:hypothetical protein
MAGRTREPLSGRRFNVLIVGASTDIEAALAEMRSSVSAIEFVWPDMPPPTPGAKATLLVRDVGELQSPDLDVLNRLIESAGHDLQVVSTSSRPLWHAVEAGEFPAGLYYRLNVIVVHAPHDRGTAKGSRSHDDEESRQGERPR